MPRKQRFKPSRKPRPMTEASQSPTIDRTSATGDDASRAPDARDPVRHEVQLGDREREARDS